MATLEESVRDLSALDRLRSEAGSARDSGMVALNEVAPRFLSGIWKAGKGRQDTEWQPPGAGGEIALVMKALSYPVQHGSAATKLAEEIGEIKWRSILGEGRTSIFIGDTNVPEPLPLLRAARCLTALASAPTAVFAPSSFMLFYYVVIRELYTADAPDWVVGGARAARGGRTCAYVTSEFMRGIRSFARSLARTQAYIAALADIQDTTTSIDSRLRHWDAEDRRRGALLLYRTLARRSWNLVLKLDNPLPTDSIDPEALDTFHGTIRADLITALDLSRVAFDDAVEHINDFRTSEEKAMKRHHLSRELFDRSRSGHEVAMTALKNACEIATNARECFRGPVCTPAQFQNELLALKEWFGVAADRVSRVLAPAGAYVAGVLNRQLTAALTTTGTGVLFDPVEMACAAASVAVVKGDIERDRTSHAAEVLGRLITEDGFAGAHPFFHVGGRRYQPSQYYALRCFAQLLERVAEQHCSADVGERVMGFFRKRMRRFGRSLSTGSTWREEARQKHAVLDTALAVSALDRFARMLDHRINDSVLAHFSFRRPQALKLSSLFYPDYGLAATKHPQHRESLAVVLERMCAHVSGVTLPSSYRVPLYSAVLYGPPATGKTTLVEALAASGEAPLVEITPSDIVVRGADMIEARARVVFQALSLLTNAVILFDEFEEVLVDRHQTEGGTRSIFQFLTPGMLPKLKTLHDSAKVRGVAYILLTNDHKKLDEAAIRPGRFDVKLGVYPPDLLSRAGRLCSVARQLAPRKNLTSSQLARCARAIQSTSLAPMETVGKPGWFSPPTDGTVERESLLGYILKKGPQPTWPAPVFQRSDDIVEELESWDASAAGTSNSASGHPWLEDIANMLEEWSTRKST